MVALAVPACLGSQSGAARSAPEPAEEAAGVLGWLYPEVGQRRQPVVERAARLAERSRPASATETSTA